MAAFTWKFVGNQDQKSHVFFYLLINKILFIFYNFYSLILKWNTCRISSYYLIEFDSGHGGGVENFRIAEQNKI